MDNKKVRKIVKEYKRHFNKIHKEEIYKWQAVKCFQDNWEIKTFDFLKMLEKSLAKANNLLDSGRYFPKRMLLLYTKKEPEVIKQLFINLYNEDEDIIERITAFKNGIKNIHKKYFSKKNDYQDDRAILVYLCLRYPDKYYFYKFKIFKKFVQLVDYPDKPKGGKIQNILKYLSLCEIVKDEILKDNELLKLHKNRISEQEYFDTSYNILTQDVIYSAVQHFKKFESESKQEPVSKRLTFEDKHITPMKDDVILKGSYTNYIENEKEKKRIGDLGELLVLQYEQEKLKSLGINKSPIHKSKTEGDGLGYDILSYDENGKEIYIEVKTTTKNYYESFFITINELTRSQQNSENYYIYRLYKFDYIKNTAKCHKFQGDLTVFCSNPIKFKVKLKESRISCEAV